MVIWFSFRILILFKCQTHGKDQEDNNKFSPICVLAGWYKILSPAELFTISVLLKFSYFYGPYIGFLSSLNDSMHFFWIFPSSLLELLHSRWTSFKIKDCFYWSYYLSFADSKCVTNSMQLSHFWESDTHGFYFYRVDTFNILPKYFFKIRRSIFLLPASKKQQENLYISYNLIYFVLGCRQEDERF